MRITIGLTALASLCLLAGCNKGAANNTVNAAPPAANAAASAPAQTPAPATNAAGPSGDMAECLAGAPEHLPAGTDANAFCTCAVGKTNAGTRQNDAIDQCAAEMHITLPTGE